MPTAPKKTWAGQWFPQGSFFVAAFVTGGQVSAPKTQPFHIANRCPQYMKNSKSRQNSVTFI